MHPRAALPRLWQDLLDRVERSSIELAGLRDGDCRSIPTGDCVRECRRQHPAFGISRDADRLVMPQPEELQRRKTRCVVADQQRDRRRAEQPVGLDVPVGPPQHRAPPRRKAHKVRDGGAGDEADRCLAWQVEQVEQAISPRSFPPLGPRARPRGCPRSAPRRR